MDMGGLTSVYPEGGSAAAKHAAIDTVKAGNDMLLLFTDLDGAYKGLLNAVRSGEIPKDANVLYAHLGGQPALNAYSGVFR